MLYDAPRPCLHNKCSAQKYKVSIDKINFQKLINETDGESSIKQFWKIYNIKDAVDNIGESWMELKSTKMNHVWKKIWPECINTNE